MVVVEPGSNPARYDLEVPIVLHEWDPFFSAENAMDVEYNVFSINGKMLGAGEPIRVKKGQRALLRPKRKREPAASPRVCGSHVRGNCVGWESSSRPAASACDRAVARRESGCDCADGRAGSLGTGRSRRRPAGGGSGHRRRVRRRDRSCEVGVAPTVLVELHTFSEGSRRSPEPESIHRLVFERRFDGHGWSINGKAFPQTDPIPAVGWTLRTVSSSITGAIWRIPCISTGTLLRSRNSRASPVPVFSRMWSSFQR